MVWLKWNELRKRLKYCSTNFSIKVYKTQKYTNLPLILGLLLISQNVRIWYVNLRGKNKVSEVLILWECRKITNVPAGIYPWMLVVGLGTKISYWVKRAVKYLSDFVFPVYSTTINCSDIQGWYNNVSDKSWIFHLRKAEIYSQ